MRRWAWIALVVGCAGTSGTGNSEAPTPGTDTPDPIEPTPPTEDTPPTDDTPPMDTANEVEVEWSIDGLALSTYDLIFEPTRRFLGDTSLDVVLTNRSGRTLAFDVAEQPGWMVVSAPKGVVESDASVAITLTVDNTAMEGELTGSLDVVLDGVHHEVFLCEGVMTPYIEVVPTPNATIDAAVETVWNEEQWVGGVVGVVHGQDVTYLEGRGYADLANLTPVDPYLHRFRWASMAKGFGGIVASQLELEGQLSLTDSVTTHVPAYEVPEQYVTFNLTEGWIYEDIPAGQRDITLRQLLAHNSCIQHYDDDSFGKVDPEPPGAALEDPTINTGMAWALDYWTDAPLRCIPGTAYNYSSFGYNLAGVALENATGQDYESLVLERIGEVVGTESLRADRAYAPVADRTMGYRKLDSGAIQQETEIDVSWKLAGGGFHGTGVDFARYCGGVMGEVLLTTAEKEQSIWDVQSPNATVALGFVMTDGGNLVSHSGRQQSAFGKFLIDRTTDTCVFVLLNSQWGSSSDLDALLEGVHAVLP
ncbi:MAG: serine hydrolase domain-containing protein [Myxococcota bacterium]